MSIRVFSAWMGDHGSTLCHVLHLPTTDLASQKELVACMPLWTLYASYNYDTLHTTIYICIQLNVNVDIIIVVCT
jgi:hypothetical protein